MKKIFILTALGFGLLHISPTQAMLCTMDYTPVCGMPYFECSQENGPILCSPPQEMTYSNKCMLESAQATFLREGVCETKQILPEATDTKYYIGNTQKCTMIKYQCESNWSGFSDDIGCGCEKQQELSEQQKENVNNILESFFIKLESKGYSSTQILVVIDDIKGRLESILTQRPDFFQAILHIRMQLDLYEGKYQNNIQ